jgi:hypothetical protein
MLFRSKSVLGWHQKCSHQRSHQETLFFSIQHTPTEQQNIKGQTKQQSTTIMPIKTEPGKSHRLPLANGILQYPYCIMVNHHEAKQTISFSLLVYYYQGLFFSSHHRHFPISFELNHQDGTKQLHQSQYVSVLYNR